MQDNISRIKVPRGFASIPVLFHLSGVVDAVATSPYFYRIVDIVDFLGDAEHLSFFSEFLKKS